MSPQPPEARPRGRPEARAVRLVPALRAPRRGPGLPSGSSKASARARPPRAGGLREERGAGGESPLSPNLFPSGSTGAFPPPPPPPPYFLRRALLPASPERSRLPSCAGGDRAGAGPGSDRGSQPLSRPGRRPVRPGAGCGFRLRPLSRDEEAGRATRVRPAPGLPAHPLRNSRRPAQVPAGVRGAEAGGVCAGPRPPGGGGCARFLLEEGWPRVGICGFRRRAFLSGTLPQTRTDHARSEAHPGQRKGQRCEKLGQKGTPRPLPTLKEGEASLTLRGPDPVFILNVDVLFMDVFHLLGFFF